jgi:hypothetical protein
MSAIWPIRQESSEGRGLEIALCRQDVAHLGGQLSNLRHELRSLFDAL